jgi:hypothetical protein
MRPDSRRHVFQAAAVVFLVLVAVVMFHMGKQHVLLLDNKTLEIDGTTYPALSLVEVRVDSQEPLELAPRDRDKADVIGQRHKISISYTTKTFEEKELTVQVVIPLPQHMVLVNIPALAGGAPQEVWMTPYEVPLAVASPQEVPVEAEDDLGVVPAF